MSKKSVTSSDEKFERQDFDLFQAIDAIDKKNYDYLKSLTEEQQRKFVPYMMIQWISTVKSNASAYYVLSADIHANKYLFNERVQKHPELQWLMLCAVSPGIGKQYHQWIPHLSSKFGELKEKAKLKEVKDYFSKIYKTADTKLIQECASEYCDIQNHRYELAKIYPDMKRSDIEVLASIVTKEDIKEFYERSGF